MIFKFHYGLWYGALVGIIPFMFNYAQEYLGATGTQHGVLYTILPFVALLAKPMVCSVADKYASHHHCLLLFISLTMLGFGSLAIYPFFPQWTAQHKDLVWILYCLAAFLGNTSMCVVNSIGDSLAMNSCSKKNINYGEYRLWGPIGFGIFGAVWGIGNEIPSLPKYTPGILTMVIILIAQTLLLAFWYDKAEFKIDQHHGNNDSTMNSPNYGSTDQSNSLGILDDELKGNQFIALDKTKKIKRMKLLWKLFLEQKSVLVFVFIFTFCGLMTGIHWRFFFKYLEKIASDNGQNFSLITTLAIPVQALGGELVFFMLAGRILKKLGTPMTLVTCLFSFATRYLLYAYLVPHVSIYWILLVELLQGPAFGLMYCVLTHQANYYSEKIDEIVARNSVSGDAKLTKSLHATLQGILGASFEGLGMGLGAIIGGLAYDLDPLLMWKIAGFAALTVSIGYSLGTVIFAPVSRSRHSVQTDIEI